MTRLRAATQRRACLRRVILPIRIRRIKSWLVTRPEVFGAVSCEWCPVAQSEFRSSQDEHAQARDSRLRTVCLSVLFFVFISCVPRLRST